MEKMYILLNFTQKIKNNDYDIDRSTGEILKNESENLTSAMNNEKKYRF